MPAASRDTKSPQGRNASRARPLCLCPIRILCQLPSPIPKPASVARSPTINSAPNHFQGNQLTLRHLTTARNRCQSAWLQAPARQCFRATPYRERRAVQPRSTPWNNRDEPKRRAMDILARPVSTCKSPAGVTLEAGSLSRAGFSKQARIVTATT